jgi:enterochelin esterase-like enzyme
MIDRRALIATAGAFSLLPGKVFGQATDSFVDLGAAPSKSVAPTKVIVWLPPGYDASKRRYGVVYMHDGQNLFDPARSNFNKVWAADKSALRLVTAGKIKPFIIVGIDQPGDDRWRQYFPAPMLNLVSAEVRTKLIEFAKGTITSPAYLEFLVNELKPLIDKRFRTKPDRRHTAIAGSSMGGLISLYATSAYPKVFGVAGCVSTHLPLAGPEWADGERESIFDAWRQYVREQLGRPKGQRIWFDHGTATLDAFYQPYQDVLDAALVANGWRNGRDFSSRVYEGAPHEENAWAARMDDIFGWMLKDWT